MSRVRDEIVRLKMEIARISRECIELASGVDQANSSLCKVMAAPAMADFKISARIQERIAGTEKLAFRLKTAADLLDVSYASLHREIMRRKIFPTRTLKLIPRKELLRYLDEEEQLARRKRTRSKPPSIKSS